MPKITYIDYSGNTNEVDVPVGNSVMQGAIDNMIDGIVAECGGCCICATCHCFVDKAWIEKTGAPGEDEESMLDLVDREENSRLACQIKVTDELDGLIVRLPESQ